MKLSPNFTLEELTHSNTAIVNGIDNTPDADTIERLKLLCCRILEPVRDQFQIPFSPHSGYRCVELNKIVGGSESSQHIKGQAVDFSIPSVSNYEVAKWIAVNLIYDQLILEPGWVHCSIVSGQNRMQCLTMNDGNYVDGILC